MLKISLKLLILFLVFLSIFDFSEPKELRDGNKIFERDSIKKLGPSRKQISNFGKFILRNLEDLTKIDAYSNFYLNALRRPKIVNNIFIKLGSKNDDEQNIIDNLLKLPNKESRDLSTNVERNPFCTYGQVFVKEKGCIFSSEINDVATQKSKSKSKKYKLNETIFSGTNKKSNILHHKKMIQDFPTENDNMNKRFRINLDNPKYKIIHEQNFKSDKDSSTIENNFETHMPSKNPIHRVEDLKYKQDDIRTKNIPDQEFNKNWIKIRNDQEFPISIELFKPYKLVNLRKDPHVINKEFVNEKSSTIHFHPSKSFKDSVLENDKSLHSKKTDTAKNSILNQEKIAFKNPDTINFESNEHQAYPNPKTNVKLVAGDFSKLSNTTNFVQFKDLSEKTFGSNKNKIESLTGNNPENIKFLSLNHSLLKVEDPNTNKKNNQFLLHQSNGQSYVNSNQVISSKEQSSTDNLTVRSLKKENEDLKNLLIKVIHEEFLHKSIESNSKKNCDSKDKVPTTHQNFSSSPKAEQTPSTDSIKNETSKTNKSLPVKVDQNKPAASAPSELPNFKVKNNEVPNKYSDLMKNVLELDKQGKVKELEKFTKSLSENSQSLAPVGLDSFLDNDNEKAVDEGEITDKPLELETTNPPVNKVSTPDFIENAPINLTESLSGKNGIANVSNIDRIKPDDSEVQTDKNLAVPVNLNEKVLGPKMEMVPKIESPSQAEAVINSTVKSILAEDNPVMNAGLSLSDFDHSTAEFPKLQGENVDTILKANAPSYSYNPLNIPGI